MELLIFLIFLQVPVSKILHDRNVSRIKDSFIPGVKQYFADEREISSAEFPSIVFPITIDLFGKNENIVFAQFVDMERHFNHIKNDYFDLKELKEVIREAKSFLVSAEPDTEKFPKQHEIWTHIRTNREFDYVDISEIDRIREYADLHGVKPF